MLLLFCIIVKLVLKYGCPFRLNRIVVWCSIGIVSIAVIFIAHGSHYTMSNQTITILITLSSSECFQRPPRVNTCKFLFRNYIDLLESICDLIWMQFCFVCLMAAHLNRMNISALNQHSSMKKTSDTSTIFFTQETIVC